jgi:hypothetical protein
MQGILQLVPLVMLFCPCSMAVCFALLHYHFPQYMCSAQCGCCL